MTHLVATIRRVFFDLPRIWPPFRFASVGAAGLVVNQAVLWIAVDLIGIHYLLGALIASQFSSAFNFFLIEIWVFSQRRWRRRLMIVRYLTFLALNLVSSIVIRLPILYLLTESVKIHYLISNMIALSVTFGLRYFVADNWIWAGRDRSGRSVEINGWFNYDLHGLLRIRSEVELPELASLSVTTDWSESADITVIRRPLLGGRPRFHNTAWRQENRICYREMPGVLGAAFDIIEADGRVRIEANWLLAWSNHVLYTNMVEPIVRFALAAKGYLLLHGASLDVRGGIILSAKTDTGKTGTTLRLLSIDGTRFLGDDMVIVGPDGTLFGYPKPLTLSSHTIRSVPAGAKLSRIDRIMLVLRSRLHSREGRRIGRLLSLLPLPVVTINAWVQLIIPPPKYYIDSLMTTESIAQTSLRAVVIIERGEALTTTPQLEPFLNELIENTDDAYTFPPFAKLAPLIRLSGLSSAELRDRERRTLRSALTGAQLIRIRVPDYSWAEQLVGLLNPS